MDHRWSPRSSPPLQPSSSAYLHLAPVTALTLRLFAEMESSRVGLIPRNTASAIHLNSMGLPDNYQNSDLAAAIFI